MAELVTITTFQPQSLGRWHKTNIRTANNNTTFIHYKWEGTHNGDIYIDNKQQNKTTHIIYVCMYCVYLLCIYKYTHIQYIIWKYLHEYTFIFYIIYINIYMFFY